MLRIAILVFFGEMLSFGLGSLAEENYAKAKSGLKEQITFLVSLTGNFYNEAADGYELMADRALAPIHWSPKKNDILGYEFKENQELFYSVNGFEKPEGDNLWHWVQKYYMNSKYILTTRNLGMRSQQNGKKEVDDSKHEKPLTGLSMALLAEALLEKACETAAREAHDTLDFKVPESMKAAGGGKDPMAELREIFARREKRLGEKKAELHKNLIALFGNANEGSLAHVLFS
ncbi:hypothetical protein DdX_16792 [Ditylenchus destructor]|uniref:Uncharacterized protein n=1 Tax=Ditylenchus destructor TaxID=166010 RepID=A0AAD4MNC3_9BILA|nr:hypothetical protein DdX_16792 [Ditylenchus destructor]